MKSEKILLIGGVGIILYILYQKKARDAKVIEIKKEEITEAPKSIYTLQNASLLGTSLTIGAIGLHGAGTIIKNVIRDVNTQSHYNYLAKNSPPKFD